MGAWPCVAHTADRAFLEMIIATTEDGVFLKMIRAATDALGWVALWDWKDGGKDGSFYCKGLIWASDWPLIGTSETEG